MAFWNDFISVFTARKQAIGETGTNNLSDFLDYSANTDYYINCSSVGGQIEAYKECEIVQSVISRHAESISNLKIWALDENNRVVDNAQTKKIIAKLNKPNPKQDFRMFFTILETYRKLHGKAYIQIVKSKLFPGQEDYYIIPNGLIQEEWDNSYDSTYNRKIKSYRIYTGVDQKLLMPDEVYVIYDNVLEFDGDRTNGASKLRSLSEVISTVVTLWEVRTELIANSGARNIISMGAKDVDMLISPFLKEEKRSIDKEMKRYGNRRSQINNLFVSTDAKVSSLTAKISEMDLPQTLKDGIKAICNAYSCPPMLIGVEDSRFKTLPEARKEFYTQAVIPSLNYLFEAFLNMMGEKTDKWHLDVDYSHLDFYQEAKKEEAIAYQQMSGAVVPLVTNGIMSIQEARVKLNLE